MSFDISVITVTWNSSATIRRLIGAVGDDAELIVVDNGSTDGTLEIVRESGGRVRLLESGENLGFGRACNLGARHAGGSVLIFMNPDAYPDPGALGALASGIQDPRIGILMPALSRSIEAVRDTVGGFLSPTLLVAQALGLWKLQKWVRIRRQRRVSVAWGFGACMAMRCDEFERLGGFQSDTFLYSEDMDLCWRVRAAGLSVLLDTRILVSHEGSHSSIQAFDAEARARLVLREAHRFLVRTHSPRYADFTFAVWLRLLPLRRAARPDFTALHTVLRDGTWREPVRAPADAESVRALRPR